MVFAWGLKGKNTILNVNEYFFVLQIKLLVLSSYDELKWQVYFSMCNTRLLFNFAAPMGPGGAQAPPGRGPKKTHAPGVTVFF